MICIEDVTFEYSPSEEGGQPVRALDGFSLEIPEGSFTAILGKNGSGKSTLSKMMNALLIPDQGDVFVCGMNTRQDELVWEIRSRAGMVFQNPDNQLISAIVEDDVAFGLENIGVPAEEMRERIDDAMKKTGIYEQRKKSPHMLSGGQKQRVAIAGVVAMRPKCIIFDEPTAMLDPKGRQEVMQIVRELREAGITIVFITHFMEEVVEADFVVVMEGGRATLCGTPAEVFSDTEKIRRAGLEVPAAVEIRERLEKLGLTVPKEVITLDALADCLAGMVSDSTGA